MTLLARLGSLGLALFLTDGKGRTETQFLPGLTYDGGREKLSGKLVFSLTDQTYNPRNNENQSTIYEIDLKHEKLDKVLRVPAGTFITSNEGDVFCILRESRWTGTNAFLYSSRTGKSSTVNLDTPSRQTVLVGGHAFFKLEQSGRGRVFDYDLNRDTGRTIALPDASTWQSESYSFLHRPADNTLKLYFEYIPAGTRVGNGRDYPMGFYSLDIDTGNIFWLSNYGEELFTFRSSDGHYIFFLGRDGPAKGYTLVSSVKSNRINGEHKPDNSDVKVLHRFNRLSALEGGSYWLQQMSPCRRYALVKLGSSGGNGPTNTYFIVDASTGDTRVLIRDAVRSKKAGFMSEVYWVWSQE